MCTVRRELFFLARKTHTQKHSLHWLDFETLRVNTVHPPHSLSRHANDYAFPTFPTLKTSVSPVHTTTTSDTVVCSFTVGCFNTSKSVTSPPPCSSRLFELMAHQQGCSQQGTSVTLLPFNFLERWDILLTSV